ncbi:TetR/AcrR family transcriptional regulator [Pendulispora albinea]|uniref:TetR/AcrR family transcriptional regulator n=1 Tax=Pendulispora albinea TaxID=2741071 RepID=A0ABZ2LQC1_9BACT
MGPSQPSDKGVPDGRRQRGDRARAKILDCSTRIASTEGLEGLTIGRVATEAGVGKGNIQVLFGDKEALQMATLEHAVALYKAAVIEPALRQASPLARLVALVDGWYAFVEKRTLPGGCFLNATSSEYRARPGRIHDRVRGYRNGTRARFRELIEEAKEAGELGRDVDASALSFDLVAHQAAANVAALMGDREEFAFAKRASRDRILGAATAAPRSNTDATRG